MSNETEIQPHSTNSRSDVIEAHVNSQERTLAVLLEQAFRIKEEVAVTLQSSQGQAQAEALSHRLLESHILTMTHIVKQLSLNVQTLEKQIAQRDSVACGTTQAVQWLDHKNMAGIGDLRGRVARCDASINRLNTEVNSGERHVIRMQQEVTHLRSAVDVRMKELEVKLQRNLGKVAASLAEVTQRQRSITSDSPNQLKQLEAQLSAKILEVVKQSNLQKKWMEQQLQYCFQSSEQSNLQLQDKMWEAQNELLERQHALESRMQQFENQLDLSLTRQEDYLKHMETKLSKRLSSVETSLHHEQQLLKHKYDKGFRSVQESIQSMKGIVDLKSRLEKEKIQKDINQICSKVAELSDM